MTAEVMYQLATFGISTLVGVVLWFLRKQIERIDDLDAKIDHNFNLFLDQMTEMARRIDYLCKRDN